MMALPGRSRSGWGTRNATGPGGEGRPLAGRLGQSVGNDPQCGGMVADAGAQHRARLRGPWLFDVGVDAGNAVDASLDREVMRRAETARGSRPVVGGPGRARRGESRRRSRRRRSWSFELASNFSARRRDGVRTRKAIDRTSPTTSLPRAHSFSAPLAHSARTVKTSTVSTTNTTSAMETPAWLKNRPRTISVQP